jgi:hypothetical protein
MSGAKHEGKAMTKITKPKDALYDIMRFRAFIESITLIGGPYPDLNGHRIVQDARRVLNGDPYER